MAYRLIGQESLEIATASRSSTSLGKLSELVDWGQIAALLEPLYPANKGEPAKKAPPAPAKAPGDKPVLIAQQQFVRLGERRGDYVQILDGLKGGESVVSNGAFKLRNGQTIMINAAHASDSADNARREMGIVKIRENNFKSLIESFYQD